MAQVNEDSVNFVQSVQDLQKEGKFASAHLLLEERMKSDGFKADLIFQLVDNCLNNFYTHKNFSFFYLQDQRAWKNSILDTSHSLNVIRIRHPERLLQRIIRNDPHNAAAFQRLGYFYDLQLQILDNYREIASSKLDFLEEKVLVNYEKAFNLGIDNIEVNRWLGSYFHNKNNAKMAEIYLKINAEKEPPDAISLFKLAKIYNERKQYTQAYDYVLKSIRNFSHRDIYIKYEALLLAAKVLHELGDIQKFHIYIHESINLLPEEQAAYLELIRYYSTNSEFPNTEATFVKLLEKNPFEEKGFQKLDQYVRKHKRFYFADSLMDELLQKYENWDEAMAKIYWEKGNLAHIQGLDSEAAKYWEFSRNFMRKYLPENHSKINRVGKVEKQK